jgi:stearoyl-CoA desaturase (delta-9 desaturase)
MSRIERVANLAGVVVPFLGVLTAVAQRWHRWVGVADLAVLAGFYLPTAVGVTVGFHRLLTHRSFQTYPKIERAMAVLGSLSVEGSVLGWVADYRRHRAHTDVEGHPHSPHVGHGSGLGGSLARPRGLAHPDAGAGHVANRSTNVAWLAIPSLGESWYHNHHAFPRSAKQPAGWRVTPRAGFPIRRTSRT